MSAALVLVPQLHQPQPSRIFLTAAPSPLAATTAALADHHAAAVELAPDPTQRKRPHRLTLVQACAADPLAPVAPVNNVMQMPLRVQPALAFYRSYTEAMLRRYFKMSLEAGRVPSLLGQDLFKGKVSNCKVTGFDDVVIFVEDVNKCLAQLDPGQRLLIRRIALEGYSQSETSAMHGLPLRTVLRRYDEALDRLTRIFLDRKLMEAMIDPGAL